MGDGMSDVGMGDGMGDVGMGDVGMDDGMSVMGMGEGILMWTWVMAWVMMGMNGSMGDWHG